MTARDIFGLIVRIVGFAIFLFGLFYFISDFTLILNTDAAKAAHDSILTYAFYGSLFTIFGMVLMRWTGILVRWTYSEEFRVKKPELIDRSALQAEKSKCEE